MDKKTEKKFFGKKFNFEEIVKKTKIFIFYLLFFDEKLR